MKSKEELLAHYASRAPKRFIQIDLGAGNPGDGFAYTDEDSDEQWWTATDELMQANTIRVLIEPTATREQALRLLRKLQRRIGAMRAGETFADERARLDRNSDAAERRSLLRVVPR